MSALGGFRNGGFRGFKHSQLDRALNAGVPDLPFGTGTYQGPGCKLWLTLPPSTSIEEKCEEDGREGGDRRERKKKEQGRGKKGMSLALE